MMNIFATTTLINACVQVFGFLVAYTLQTDKVRQFTCIIIIFQLTDFSYGTTFAVCAVYSLLQNDAANARQVLVTILTSVWGIRLSLFLFTRIFYMKKDDRFDKMRPYFFRFASFWVIQFAAIVIINAPVIVLNSAVSQFKSFDVLVTDQVGAAIALFGLIIEIVADYQKFTFKNKFPKQFMQQGLFAFCRYPNYLGEISFWIGIFVLCSTSFTVWYHWLTIASPLFITWLLLRLSGIPLLERQAQKKYGNDPEYRAYVAKTAKLVPVLY